MVATAVIYDPTYGAWAVEHQPSGRRVYYSTEDEAWDHSGLLRPPGRYPVTEKDWE